MLRRCLVSCGLTAVTVMSLVGAMTPEMFNARLYGRPGSFISMDDVSASKANDSCSDAVAALFGNTTDVSLLFTVEDATGKPTGFENGNLAWLGSFQECNADPRLRYCLITFVGYNVPELKNQTIMIRWGLCALDACSEHDVAHTLQVYIKQLLRIDWLIVTDAQVSCAKEPTDYLPYGAGFYGTVTLSVVLLVLVLLGSLLDAQISHRISMERDFSVANGTAVTNSPLTEETPLIKPSPRTSWEVQSQATYKQKFAGVFSKFLLCFSLPSNLRRLLNTNTGDNNLSSLNGIRVFSILWVILGHSYLFTLLAGATENMKDVMPMIKRFTFQAIENGFYSVDSFFFLSGLLVTYLTLGLMKNKTDGRLPIIKFYFHRWWRLTPLLMYVILFDNNITPYTGNGPLWKGAIVGQRQCETYWWTNMLYINNFYPASFMQGCIDWTWYLANDMQFYAISPIVIVLMYRLPRCGYTVSAIMILICCTVSGLLMGVYDLRNNSGGGGMNMADLLKPKKHDYMSLVYVKPYCRINPYVVGMLLGKVILDYEGHKKRLNKLVVVVGWAVAIAVALSVVYGLYGNYNGHAMTTAEAVIYEAFARLAWSLCLSWVVLMCYHGYAGWVNSILSWRFWVPLGRMTYSVYLIHPLVMSMQAFGIYSNIHLSDTVAVFNFLSFAFISYLAAFVATLVIEFPCGNLEKLVLGAGKEGRN